MHMRLALGVLFALILLFLSPAYAVVCSPGAETRITSNSFDQTRSKIYGNTIVYQDNRNGDSDIYMYDLGYSTETRITDESAAQDMPVADGNLIVWVDYTTGNGDLYMCDLNKDGSAGGCLATDAKTRITSDLNKDWRPDIDGNIIVWDKANPPTGWDIFMCDLNMNGSPGGCFAENQKSQITAVINSQVTPTIYETKIVWVDNNGNYALVMCDLTKNGLAEGGGCLVTDLKTQLTSRSAQPQRQDIYDQAVAWSNTAPSQSDRDVSRYDLQTSSEYLMADGVGDNNNATIYGTIITWTDYRNINADIYMCNLALNGSAGGCLATDEKARITTDSSAQYSPAIHKNKIVWTDNRNGNLDIYMNTLVCNNEPVFGSMPDQNLLDDSGFNDNLIDLWQYASDAETPDEGLVFSVLSQSDASMAQCSVDMGRYLDCNVSRNTFGSTDINVQVSDGQLSGMAVVRVNVAEADLTTNPLAVWGGTENTSSIIWGDVDNDGDFDLAVGNAGSDNFVYPYPFASEIWRDYAWSDTTSVAFGDVDNDGDLDLAVGNLGEPILLYENVDGNLTNTSIWNNGQDYNTLSVAFGDVDNDGDLDLAVGNCETSSYVYENVGGALTTSVIWTEGEGGCTRSIAFGDVDNDGDLDLAVGNLNGNNFVYKNTNGILETNPTWNDGRTDNTTSVAWGDVDNDGDLDLAIGNDSSNNLVYENVGGNLTTNVIWNDGQTDETKIIAFGDVDNDGYIDLAVGNAYAGNFVYANAGGVLTTNTLWDDNGTDRVVESVSWYDIDNDADLDLAVGGWGYYSYIYENVESDYNNPNSSPVAPVSGYSNSYSCVGSELSLAWGGGSDAETPEQSLYYNIRLGTSSGAQNVVTGVYGQSGEAAYYGNGMLANFRNLKLPNNNYYWAVQSIDTSLKASAWSAERFSAADALPMVGGIPDLNLLEDSGFNNNLVDLWAYASDNSTADLNLVYAITSQSAPGIVNCALDQNRYIDCTTQPDQNGYSDIGVEVWDECGQPDSTVFRVNVIAVNDAPVVDDGTETIVENTPTNINFDPYVNDPDNADSEMSWAAVGSANIAADVSGNMLTLTPAPDFCDVAIGETISIMATDPGMLSDSGEINVFVSCINGAPAAAIITPPNGASFTSQDPILLAGMATDEEDGNLTGNSLLWSSDIDGIIGSGESTLATLSVGTHTITLTATDSDDLNGYDSVSITMLQGNSLPIATIASPANDANFACENPIAFSGSATDIEDGQLTGSALEWSSNISGLLGSGETISATLSSGVHTITLTATDSLGGIGTDTLNVRVICTNIVETQVTNNPESQTWPAIYGDKVVWTDFRGGNYDIYMYNLSTEAETRITRNAADQAWPSIYGDKIVYHDNRKRSYDANTYNYGSNMYDLMYNYDIYMYDLSTRTETQITTSTAKQEYPAIYGDKIVWRDSRNGNYDIYMYDLDTNTETRVTTNTGWQNFPAISGGRIVWPDNRNGNWDIYMYDISTGTESQITTNTATQERPAIYGNNIVWLDYRNKNADIYMYDVSTGTETKVPTGAGWKKFPDIYENKIVYEDDRNNMSEIYLYDLLTGIETQITTNALVHTWPAIYGNNIVWHTYADKLVWQPGKVKPDIYLAAVSQSG